MSLKLKLKPREKVVIGEALISNGDTPTEIFIENNVPLLREKDILTEARAETPGKRIYFIIQLMYFDRENLKEHHKTYWKLVQEYVKASPSSTGYVQQISELLLVEKYYPALKLSKKLIEYEDEVIRHAQPSA